MSENSNPTLAEWLLERIADEEEAWRGGLGLATRPEFSNLSQHMLADCAAKRRVVQEAAEQAPYLGSWESVLQWLALPYADHPDYRDEWRP